MSDNAKQKAQQMMGGMMAALGFELVESDPDRVVIGWTVDERHRQPYGIVHGGLYCTAVETAGSIAGALWFGDRGQVVGVANHTNFLRAAREGHMTATATPIHRGNTAQLWLVEVRDDDERLLARGELRLQNLAHRPGGGIGTNT